MAERVVSLLVEKLEAWIEQEIELLRGVSGEISDIKDEFVSIGAFLREADAMVDNDVQMEVWVQQVRDVADEIERVLDEYILVERKKQGDHSCVRSSKDFFQGIADCFKCLQTKQDIGTRIKGIKKKIISISERRQRYDISSSVVPSLTNNVRDPREDALFLEETQVVGIDEPRKILIDYLLEEHTRLGVISLYGIGGLGKTTLVKKVYDASTVKEKFHLRAWITVSQVFDAKTLLKGLYIDLFGRVEELEKMELLKLKQELHAKLQGRRYLVVLDDIWKLEAWKGLKNALPDDSISGSRIIITTRSETIAGAAAVHGEVIGHMYPLKALNPEDSWELFSKKVFNSNPKNPHVPTLELKERAAKFLKKCNGLPLGLVAIGGLLSTKLPGEWDQIYERFQEFMDGSLSSEVDDVRLVISFSYNELPFRLKSCFLYLGIFPEDHLISCSTLFQMWSAEACVVRDHQENLSIEELAKPYLEELIQRSLVQVEVVDARGKVLRCKIHDLIRDFIIGKAGNRNCTTLFCTDREAASEVEYAEDPSSRLRVLYLKRNQLKDFEARNLSHLRYLSVKYSGDDYKYFSIEKFKHLETVDFRGQYMPQLGKEILQLTQLRNLLTGKHSNCPSTCLPEGMHMLKKLERLEVVRFNEHDNRKHNAGKALSTNELCMLTQLRKLSVTNLTEDDETQLFGSIQKLKFLKTFKVKKWNKFSHSQSSYTFPQSLQCLAMIGYLEQIPPWISSLQNLERLMLSNLHAQSNFVESLEALPNLMVLELGGSVDEWIISSGSFSRLRKLVLFNFSVGVMTVKEGAMPNIRSISFANDSKIMEGLSYLTSLEEIIIHKYRYRQHVKYLPNDLDLAHRLKKYSWQQGHQPLIVVGVDSDPFWPRRYD